MPLWYCPATSLRRAHQAIDTTCHHIRVDSPRLAAALPAVGRRDVMDARPTPIFLVKRVQADKVFLRVAGNLRGGARDDATSRDAPPVPLAKFGEPEEKRTMLLLGPRDPLTPLLFRGLA